MARETLVPEDLPPLAPPADAAPTLPEPALEDPVPSPPAAPDDVQPAEAGPPVGERLPDPFAAAEAALARARAARGVRADDPREAPIRRASSTDPFGAAEDALARAREARATTGVDRAPGRTDRALAQAKAAAELRRLKAERDED